MGQGIAQSLALGGWSPVLVDRVPELAEAGLACIERSLAAAVEADRMPAARADETVARISVSSDLAGASAAAEVILEAVPEVLTLKRDVWAEISAAAIDGALLATNTSALDIDAIADAVRSPERFVGIHWYNPAQLVPGVEIVPGRATSPDTVARALALMTAVGKKPFVVRNAPGFVGNRLQFALIAEAFRCLEEGLATADDIDAIVRSTFGMRLGDFGPLRLADLGGLDTYISVLDYFTETLGERYSVSPLLRELGERGNVGVKSGRGVFPYMEGEAAALLATRDAALARRLDDRVDVTTTASPLTVHNPNGGTQP